MKLFQTTSLLALLSSPSFATQTQSLRRVLVNGRPSRVPCLVYLSDIQFEDGHDEELPLECELQGEDANGKAYGMVKVDGVPPGFVKNKRLESGVSTIFAKGAQINWETNTLVVPNGAEITIGRKSNRSNGNGNNSSQGRRLNQVTKRVLVLRAEAADASSSLSEAELSDDVFGTDGDVVNLKNQYAACSYNQLIFDKVLGNTVIGPDSVYTVNIPDTVVAGADNGVIRSAIVDQATADLGNLPDQFDYVMVCMPPGTNSGWIAYAYVNHWLSVYNDKWCASTSAQMHELGHNLGLAHSGEGTASYADQSGMMGFSYSDNDGPEMCFNGAKTHQLGWFSSYHKNFVAGSSAFEWTGSLIGFAEKNDASSDDKMIIQIQAASDATDIYVHFNAAKGFNAETLEGKDQVLVTTRAEGLGYSASTLAAKLNSGESYTYAQFNGIGTDDLIVTVNSIDTSQTPFRASVTVRCGTVGVNTPVPTPVPLEYTPAPTTTQPTPFPTNFPTPFPTSPPVEPTPSPTTAQPTPSPTPPPVEVAPTAGCDNNGLCETGEDCNSCPNDCKSQGNVCCVGGACDSWKCTDSVFTCIREGGTGGGGGGGKNNGNGNGKNKL